MIADKQPWTVEKLYSLPQVTQIVSAFLKHHTLRDGELAQFCNNLQHILTGSSLKNGNAPSTSSLVGHRISIETEDQPLTDRQRWWAATLTAPRPRSAHTVARSTARTLPNRSAVTWVA